MTSAAGWQPSSLVTRVVLWPPEVFEAVEGLAHKGGTTFTGLVSEAVKAVLPQGLDPSVEKLAAEALPRSVELGATGLHTDAAALLPALDDPREMRTLYWEDDLDRGLEGLSDKLPPDVVLLACVLQRFHQLQKSIGAHEGHAHSTP